jgi:hypothetical protein
MVVSFIPGVLRDFTMLVRSDEPHGELSMKFLAIHDAAKILLGNLRQWHDEYFRPFSESGIAPKGTILCILALYSSFCILLSRILSSVSATVFPQSTAFEARCQRFAQDILEIVATLEKDGLETILIAQKIKIAEATAATKDDWARFHGQTSGFDRPVLVDLPTFRRWCDLFGRTTE